jgi:hypothetical protein
MGGVPHSIHDKARTGQATPAERLTVRLLPIRVLQTTRAAPRQSHRREDYVSTRPLPGLAASSGSVSQSPVRERAFAVCAHLAWRGKRPWSASSRTAGPRGPRRWTWSDVVTAFWHSRVGHVRQPEIHIGA